MSLGSSPSVSMKGPAIHTYSQRGAVPGNRAGVLTPGLRTPGCVVLSRSLQEGLLRAVRTGGHKQGHFRRYVPHTFNLFFSASACFQLIRAQSISSGSKGSRGRTESCMWALLPRTRGCWCWAGAAVVCGPSGVLPSPCTRSSTSAC